MRRVCRCSRCACALVRTPAGFTATDELFCGDRGSWVEPDDGCTFGSPGQPSRATFGESICIGDDAAKGGAWQTLGMTGRTSSS